MYNRSGDVMKVLTLKEPGATLIKEKKKLVETRSWKTNYRGELYIHGSQNVLKEWINNPEIMNLLQGVDLNCGKIICKCELVDCIYMTKEYVEKMKKNPQEYLVGIYQEGRYAWVLKNIEVLEKPIEAKGHLGIWNYEE